MQQEGCKFQFMSLKWDTRKYTSSSISCESVLKTRFFFSFIIHHQLEKLFGDAKVYGLYKETTLDHCRLRRTYSLLFSPQVMNAMKQITSHKFSIQR